jgi:hypothetical protein
MIKKEDSLMFAATEKKLSLGLKPEGWTMHKISLALERSYEWQTWNDVYQAYSSPRGYDLYSRRRWFKKTM